MLAVILMSGKGERFSKFGFKDPKPLIQLDEKMMFEYSVDHFAHPNKFLFVVTNKINENPKFINFINNFDHEYEIIIHDQITNGQATSLYLAVKNFSNEQGFFVSSCDLSFKKIKNVPLKNNIIFTTRPKKVNFENSDQYGWVDQVRNKYKITCKKMPKTNNKLRVIIGCFYFRSLIDFKTAYENMVKANSKINNEYYLDNIFNFEPLNNYISVFEVDNYKSFGSPQEIKDEK